MHCGRPGLLVAGTLLPVMLGLLLAACSSPAPAPTAPPPQSPRPVAPTAAIAPAVPATPTGASAIKVGGLFDLTGATSEVSLPYADAVRLYVQAANGQGGVNGRKVELVEVDYAYQVPKAVDAYKKFLSQDKVVAILGWGTADTEALSPLVGQDKIPYMSASYAESLVDNTTNHPYNFLLGTTYSDQMRVLLKYVKDNWKQTDRKAGVAFVYPDNPYGRSPIPTGREVAGRLGINVVDEQLMSFDALDATAQLRSIQLKGADFIIINSLTPATAVAVKDAAKLGLKAQIITLNWASDEDLVKRAGSAADMVIGATPFTFLSEDSPGFNELKAAYKAKGSDPGTLTVRQVQGWLTAKLMLEGIKRAGDKVTGETIKAGLETIRDYDTGGITAPITWTKEDHAGNKYMKLYQVRNGAWVALTEFVKAER